MSLPVEYTTEWIPAWRWFSLNYKKGQLVLSGLTHDYHGYHVEAVANCGMEKYGNLPGFQPHQAPGEDCS